MEDDRPNTSSFASRLGAITADLAAVLVVVILVNLTVFAPVVRETPVRIPLVLVFVLLVPGYAVTAALFPERGETADNRSEGDRESVLSGRFRSRISGIERVALSVGLSVVIVPAIAYPLTLWYGEIRFLPITIVLSAFTLLLTATAVVRRWTVAEGRRASSSRVEWLTAGRSELFPFDSRSDFALTVLLIMSLLLAAGSLGFAAANLPREDQFSSITVLGETDDGELTANNYPTELDAEESEDLVIEVDNHEYRTEDYSVVVVEQSLESRGNGTVVEEQRVLDRFEFSLSHDEVKRLEYSLNPSFTGEKVRIAWLLYVDEVPDDPSIENAPYHTHVVVEVE